MPHWASKETIDVVKGLVEIADLVAILYFGYRLLAGMYVLGRVEMELVSDTPFADKTLVRSTLKLKNVGEATLRVTDARLSTFALDVEGRAKPSATNAGQPPKVPLLINRRDLNDLDFQRVSIPSGTGQGEQPASEPEHQMAKHRTVRHTAPEFLQRLQPGFYKLEFRLIAYHMFGRWYSLLTLILRATAFISLTRAGQWVATSVVQAASSRRGEDRNYGVRLIDR